MEREKIGVDRADDRVSTGNKAQRGLSDASTTLSADDGDIGEKRGLSTKRRKYGGDRSDISTVSGEEAAPDREGRDVFFSAMSSLAGFSVVARVSNLQVVVKGAVSGVHRSIPDDSILGSLKNVRVMAATCVKARDARFGTLVKTDRAS